MPKAKVENEISNDGKFATVEMEVTERDTKKAARYVKPLTFEALQELISTAQTTPMQYKQMFPLTDRESDAAESEQAFLLRLMQSAISNWARADVYQSLSAESTVVTIAGEKLDLMTVKTPAFINGYNGNVANVTMWTELGGGSDDAREAAERKFSFKSWRTAARKHVEGYEDASGNKVAPDAKFEGNLLVKV